MKKYLRKSVVAALALAATGSFYVQGAFDENLQMYTLDAVVVTADRTKNKFGDTITEQSYYRTGGDVKVITREEIEKRHYTDLTEAIKRIPGVTFQNPGYRGGEYGYQFYNNGVSINGDTRVIVLVDGRRVDNAASTRISGRSTTGSKSTGVNLDQVTNIDNVDKIEVVKGPGASAYGADATGGVINIITRKGGSEPVGSIDLATGSWGKHHYAFTYSGAAGDDKSWHYFISANRDMSGDTEYKDPFTGETAVLGGSHWKEEGVNLRVDKEINDKQDVKIWYNYRNGRDGYPIAVPNRKYWNQADWERIIFNASVGTLDENNKLVWNKVEDKKTGEYKLLPTRLSGDGKNPGYHNLYALDGKAYGSFSRFKNKDWDIVYTFNREKDLESFVRLYSQDHTYSNRDKYQWYIGGHSLKEATDAYEKAFPNGATKAELKEWISNNLAPFPDNEEALAKWVEKTGGKADEPTSWQEEKNRGVQFQYGRSLGKHDIIADVLYDQAKNYSKSIRDDKVESSYVKRNTWQGYVQDKIHVSDKWDITPALRYSKYSSFEHSTGDVQGKGSAHSFTYALNTEYLLNDTTSMYFGWAKVYRPLREGDYSITDTVFNKPLQDEKGNAWNVGIRKELGNNTTIAAHYSLLKMSNAIAKLPVMNPDDGKFKSTPINAKEDKESFNLTLEREWSDHVTVSASYSHMKETWKSKDEWTLSPEWGILAGSDINAGINHLRPQNQYALNVSYQNGGVYTGLLINWYTGCSPKAFSDNQFLVIDWNVNYTFNDNLTVYGLVGNLTNESYETSYNAWNGIGSSAMPGRYFMMGAKYTF